MLALAFAALGALLPVTPGWVGGSSSSIAQAAAPSCVAFKGEARSNGYGFKHVVVLTSACPKIADCEVSTDVNPTVVKVEVAPKATVEVLTFLDSPVSGFTPKVKCTQRK